MTLTDKQTQWLIRHFKHTKNDDITARLNISMSYLHRLARALGLKKTRQFMRKTQANAVVHAQAAIAAEDEEAKERRRQQANQNRNPDRCFKPGIYALATKTAEERAEINAKRAATWRKTRKDDEIRLNWLGEQRTNFHFARDPDHGKNQAIIKLRCYLRNLRGYDIPGKAGMIIYITAETKRSPKMEQRAQKLGMIIREKK